MHREIIPTPAELEILAELLSHIEIACEHRNKACALIDKLMKSWNVHLEIRDFIHMAREIMDQIKREKRNNDKGQWEKAQMS